MEPSQPAPHHPAQGEVANAGGNMTIIVTLGGEMESVNVARLKASLSAYLAKVKAGEEVVVTERGRPIAKLSPVRLSLDDPDRVRELARQGRIRLPENQADPQFWEQFWKLPHPEDPRGLALQALLEEREDGR